MAQSVVAAPSVINFQGRLANPSGNPVPDGTYSIRFSLWNAVTGGTERWNKTVANVAVRNGTFAVKLDTFSATTFNENLWFEIKVGSDAPLSPRQQLVSIPYAIKSNIALTVPDASITNAKLAGGITSDKFAPNTFNSLAWLLGGNSGTNPTNHFLGTVDNQPLVFRTNNTEKMRIDSNSNVGIGTSTPQSKLEVVGTIIGSNTNADGVRGFSQNATGVYGESLFGHAGWFTGNVNVTAGIYAGNNVLIDTQNANNGGLDNSVRFGGLTGEAIASKRTAGGNQGGLDFYTAYANRMVITNGGNVGVGTTSPRAKLETRGNVLLSGERPKFLFDSDGEQGGLAIYPYLNGRYIILTPTDFSGNELPVSEIRLGGQGLFNDARVKLVVNDTMSAKVIEITGGSDIAEPYSVSPADDVKPLPGMVVCIDPENEGKMRVASKAYDKLAGGILSGANGIKPGLTLRQEGTIADGEMAVASVGRVYCWCDADANGAIEAGDLLTTSDTPGHAMKVTDYDRSQGATIGKAMTSLKSGKGLVLVLVTLR